MVPMIPRAARKGGVLPCTFVAPPRAALVGATRLPAAYSKIIGTAICLGQNDVLADCLPTMAYNAGLNAWARKGVFQTPDNTEPPRIFRALGGMPENVGLDPAVLIEYWRHNPICGHLLRGIEALALTDFDGMRSAVIDFGFLCLTAQLTQAQMTQARWRVEPNSPPAGRHAFCATWYEADCLYDDTWGEEIPMEFDFVARQGLNAWRCELAEA